MEKKCTRCKLTKPLKDFYKVANGINGVRPRCKICCAEIEREKYGTNAEFRWNKCSKQYAKYQSDPIHRAKHMVAQRRWHLKTTYGITQEDFDIMLTNQGGGCAICNRKPNGELKHRMVVDHCHTTKKIRGILCDLCNTALGKFQDDTKILFDAIMYLKNNG